METVTCRTLEEGILEVRMNRPERLNAINATLIKELIQVFQNLQHDRKTRVATLVNPRSYP